MFNVNSIDAEIKELLDAEFEPFLNAVEFLTFFSKIVDYTYSQLAILMDRKIENKKRNIRAITINDFEDYGFFDKNKLFKVMNSFSDISGFSFSVMSSIAFLAHTEEDNIFISVNDLKEIDETLIDVYPKSRLFYIHKSRLEKNDFVNLAGNKELKALREENAKQSNEITRLKAEIAELKAQSAENGGNISTVDYNSFSIYGHTTPAIKAIFETIHRFWRHHDLSQPDTITNAKDIIGWIREQYPENEIGKVMAESIQKITRPPEARLVGSKGNNKRGNHS